MPRGRRADGGSVRDAAYYVSSDSDLAYARRAHARAVKAARRRWALRALVVVLLAAAAYLWGPALAAFVRARASSAAQQVRGVGQRIRSDAERRSGAGLDETSP